MKTFHYLKIILIIGSFLITPTAFSALNIVAAESFYGDVANQLGHPYVTVTSVMNNPNQDPHLFSASPKIAILLHQADIIIENGVGYDSWMSRLYQSSNKAILLNVGKLVHKTPGMNPHIWYDPQTMPVFAQVFTQKLIQCDPNHKTVYQKNLAIFLKKAQTYQIHVSQVREKVSGMMITATEPIVGYLVQALGLHMLNNTFQQDIMNETDLTPGEIIHFEESLRDQKTPIKLFIYNKQVSDPTTNQLKKLASQNHISILGVSETMPPHKHYYSWMNETLKALERKLI